LAGERKRGGGAVMMERRVQYRRCDTLIFERKAGFAVTCMSKNGCLMHISHACKGRDESALATRERRQGWVTSRQNSDSHFRKMERTVSAGQFLRDECGGERR
jgi:hypothetical protein